VKKIIFIITGVFVFAALINSPLQQRAINSLGAYFLYLIDFIAQNYFTFILGFIVLIIIFFRYVRFDRNYSLKKNYLLSIFQLINILFIAFFASYVILLFIALAQLNTFSILININPKILGIVDSKNTVVSTLKKNNYPPKIVTSSDEQNTELAKIAGTFSGTNSFYGYYILPSIPGFLVLPTKYPASSLLLIDNTLIIARLNSNDLQEISPAISYLLVQKYFLDRKIKSYPKITIMNKVEYQKYRQKQFEKDKVTVNEEMEKYKNQIASASASIINDKNTISYNKNLVDKLTSEYKKCLANGDYSLVFCKDLLSKSGKSELEKEIVDLNAKLLSDQDKLKKSQKYYDFYIALGKQVQLVEGTIPEEFGAFTPKDVIGIAFNTADSSHAVADYLETLVHEYIHYASYISENKKLSDSFFEEGLTEYFARQIIKDNLDVSINLGYPVYARIFGQMTKRILENDLADIYFSKDQSKLQILLDRAYGEGFYEDSRILFLNLQYASDKNQILKFANEIMKKLGGEPLKEKDIFSTKELPE
jgi:hypothetical protein